MDIARFVGEAAIYIFNCPSQTLPQRRALG